MPAGIKVLVDVPGEGQPVERQHVYLLRLKTWLNRGDLIRWQSPWGLLDRARLEDDGTTLIADLRIDREHLFSALFYGIEGMRVGGTRKLRISPHMAYGQNGCPASFPAARFLWRKSQYWRSECCHADNTGCERHALGRPALALNGLRQQGLPDATDC
jgi:hypothetical protein